MKNVTIPLEIDDFMEFIEDAEAGRVFKAILKYARQGRCGDLTTREKALFNKVRPLIENQEKIYREKSMRMLQAKQKYIDKFSEEIS